MTERKTGGARNVGNRIVCIAEQLAGCFKAPAVQVLDWREPCEFGKRVCHIILVHVCQAGEFIQRNVLSVVCVQVFFDLSAFFCHADSIDRNRDHLLGPDNAENQDFKKMLTDHVRTIPLFFYFKINLSKQIGNELPVVEVAENLSSILCVFRLECNAVNSDHIVFQRQTRNGLFRVLQIWGNNDQITCFNGAYVIVKKKVPLSVQDKENLSKVVGMGDAAPVLFVFGK